MLNDTTDVIAAAWLFGALLFWPIALVIDNTTRPSLRLLKWASVVQFTLQVLWGIWLAILWSRGVSHIEQGLIPLYIIGTVGWIAALAAFLYWLIERRKPQTEKQQASSS